jgi:hypothetical protein
MSTIFSETLMRLRRDAGFPTAYKFYHTNGGKPVFKISYRMYLFLEQGKRIPPMESLGTYIFALKLLPKTAPAVDFMSAWLKTYLGEENFRNFIEPLLVDPRAAGEFSPLQNALKRNLDQKTLHLSPGQLEVVCKSKASHLCWTAMLNDSGSWAPEKLAGELGLTAAETKKAITELAAAKLIKRAGKTAYTCLFAGSIVVYPYGNITRELQARFNALREELVASGSVKYFRRAIIRTSASEFVNFMPIMALNITAADSYSITEKRKDSELVAVECKIVKLRDF